MHVERTPLSGLLVIEPRCFHDERGFFLESFQLQRYRALGITDDFVQDNHSRSKKGVLRGLHFQVQNPQAQILTVMRGRIFDVAVDLRRGSATFARWFGTELSEDGPRQIYIAPGFAHGFCVLSETADLHYKASRTYDRSDEGGLIWNDLEVRINWPVAAPIVSARDAAFPRLHELQCEKLPHIDSSEGASPPRG
jgi:dTDP-4-dehydrorhamnose 3,5-epimerase